VAPGQTDIQLSDLTGGQPAWERNAAIVAKKEAARLHRKLISFDRGTDDVVVEVVRPPPKQLDSLRSDEFAK